MDISPRNTFNCRLAGRYWQIPTAIPQATHYNVPIGTHFCDQLGFLCHPQEYRTFHRSGEFDGRYRDITQESKLLNLDYYNLYDSPSCPGGGQTSANPQQQLSPELIKRHYQNTVGQHKCPTTPKLWYNTTKLHKYNQY